jgi:hypothetical protein
VFLLHSFFRAVGEQVPLPCNLEKRVSMFPEGHSLSLAPAVFRLQTEPHCLVHDPKRSTPGRVAASALGT